MSPSRDFGPTDDNEPDPDQPHDEEDQPMTAPDPIEPDQPPGPERAIEAPKQSHEGRGLDAPTAGQLYQMFPDAFPTNSPERRKRHLAAVPDPSDLATLPASAALDEDDDDPLIATALRLRLVIAFWWRPASTAVAVVVIAVCAFLVTGPVVGIAWCFYGAGWTAHAIWAIHGRPSLRHLTRTRRRRW